METSDSRVIASQDLTTAGFYDMADQWSIDRRVERFSNYRIRDSFLEASSLDLLPNEKVMVTALDIGTHVSAVGDVGSVDGQTPNSGYFYYNSGVAKLIRISPLESEIAQTWAEGDEPGGVGTKSAKAWTTDAQNLLNQIDTTATTIQSQLTTTLNTVNSSASVVNSDKIEVATNKDIVLTQRAEIDILASDTLVAKDITLAAADEALEYKIGAQAAATLSNTYYPGARTYVPQGAVTGAGTVTTPGSGGTDGTYDLIFTGGNFAVNPTGTFTVAGGVVTTVTITGPGYYVGASITSPTLTFTNCPGLTGAVGSFNTKYLKASGEFYLTDHATNTKIRSEFQNQGDVAVEITPVVDWLNYAGMESTLNSVNTIAGLISPVDVLKIHEDLIIPKTISWRTTAGRLKRIGQCNWAKCNTNEARVYIGNSGTIDGVIFDGSETIKSADYFTAPVNSSSPQYITNSGSGSSISQVGSHAQYDIAGGTGKLCYGTPGTATTQFRALNLSHSVVSGDTIRVCVLACFTPSGASYAPRLGITNISGSAITSTANLTIPVTGSATIVRNTSIKAGIDVFDTDINGNVWYRAWCDIAITGTGTYAPYLQMPASSPAVKFMVWSIKNPTQLAPSAVPVLSDATFSNDAIQVDSSIPLEVEWKKLCVGRTSVSNGLLYPPRMVHTPAIAIEKSITLKKAQEFTELEYALPGPRSHLLFPNSGTVNVLLGPGYWGGHISVNLATSYTIKGAYADPKKWPRLRSAQFSTGINYVELDRLCFWLRTPRGTSIDPSQFTLSIEVPADNIILGDILIVGADGFWSQYLSFPDDGYNNGIRYRFGNLRINPTASGTVNINRVKSMKAYSGVLLGAGNNNVTFNFAVGFASEKVTADHVFVGTGNTYTTNINMGHHTLGEIEVISFAYWQTQYEIEVNVGSGWQNLSASGLTASQLPIYRKFYKYGSHNNGVVTISPQPEQSLYVHAFVPTLSLGATSKPGYQYGLSPISYRDPSSGELLYIISNIPDDTVWVSDTLGSNPSPTNPRIRIRHKAGRWSGSTFISEPNTTRVAVAGNHGDNIQWGINTTSGGNYVSNYTCNNVLWLNPDGQGYFSGDAARNNTVNVTARGLFFVGSPNGVYVTGNANISGFMWSMWRPNRDVNGNGSITRLIGTAGGTVNAGGLYIGTTSAVPTGYTGGTTVTSPPTPVAAAKLTYNNFISSEVDQPTAPLKASYFFPPEMLYQGTVKESITIDTLKVTGFMSEALGFDVNGLLETCRGPNSAWGYFKELEPLCVLAPPTHYTSIANTSTVGTSLVVKDTSGNTVTLKGSYFTEGDPKELFKIESGVLKVNNALLDWYNIALVDNLALITDAGELISVKVF